MKRTALIVLVLVVVAGGAAALLVWRFTRPRKPSDELALYGNVDLRQVELAFNNNERMAAVLVQEGDRVRAGQVLARLDESRLAPQVAQADAQRAAQAAVVERLHNGSRPEEIAQGKANVEAAEADVGNARAHYDRLRSAAATSGGGAVSQQELDDAKAVLDTAAARLQVNRRALDLLVIGPRAEDIAQAEAQLRANEAQLAFLRRQLADAILVAPLDAVVRSRLLEPGDMASPLRSVFTLAIIDPKWVRAYVSEPDLGKVHPGMPAYVTADSFPGRRFEGWLGFVSSVAEFTPKPVQTDELRTKLVYEVRIFVKDPGDDLRLGMPATAHLSLNAFIPATLPAATAPTIATTTPTAPPVPVTTTQESRAP
jgi:HlyD family secretion protein